jgi:hypothetical protein
VYANDEFDYTDEPPQIMHKSVRPGHERGPLIAAYAVAIHRDGRREQIVLHWDEIEQRRGKAQTDMVWREWPAPMAEKTAGHALFKQMPISDRELVARVLAASGADAAELLYGPDGHAFTSSPAPLPAGDDAAERDMTAADSLPQGDLAGTGGSQQADPETTPGTGSATGTHDPEPGTEDWSGEVIPIGNNEGKTLAAAAATEEGRRWLEWAVRNPGRFSDHPGFHDRLAEFVASSGARGTP